MGKKNPDEFRLSPQDYRAMLKHVQLEDISLEECSAKVRRDKPDKSVGIAVKDKISAELQGENSVQIDHSYELVASPGAKKDFVLKIACVFRLRYSSNEPLTEDFLEIFRKRNVPLNTWPFFRELVQSITQRMNLPPLTLPLLK